MKILNYVVSPITKSNLSFKFTDNRLITKDETEIYKVDQQICFLLPKSYNNSNHIDHYQKDAELFDYFEETPESWTVESTRLQQAILSNIKTKASSIILDVGSGGGWLEKYVTQKTDASIISMDISEKNIRELQKRYPSPKHFGIVGDAMNLPIKSNSIDFIVASEIIEHVPEPEIFIKNLLSSLKKKGKLIISTPYKEKIVYSLCIHCN
jgi:2-polyprenyl-3-methyl-5-hydroxy-6-metoxy-1,4-benzoquinol methylase